jgi:hypothetical protein
VGACTTSIETLANEDGGFMRKALVTAFVIAGGFVGCAGTPPPAPATHVVVGEASYVPVAIHSVVADDGDHSDTDGVHGGGPPKCPRYDPTCIPQ